MKEERPELKVLIIDDDEIALQICGYVLRECGDQFSLDTCYSATDALRYLEVNKKAFPDIILCDINMPVKNGWDFVEEIKSSYSEQIGNTDLYMYTSSKHLFENEKAAKDPIVKGLIQKPITKDQLEILIERAMIC